MRNKCSTLFAPFSSDEILCKMLSSWRHLQTLSGKPKGNEFSVVFAVNCYNFSGLQFYPRSRKKWAYQKKRKEVLYVGKKKFIMNYWVDIFAVVVASSHFQDIFYLLSRRLAPHIFLCRGILFISASCRVGALVYGLSSDSTRRTHKFGLFIVFFRPAFDKRSSE